MGCHACGRAGALLARLLGRDSWALGVGLAWANGLGWEEGLLVGLVTGLAGLAAGLFPSSFLFQTTLKLFEFKFNFNSNHTQLNKIMDQHECTTCLNLEKNLITCERNLN